MGVRADGVFAVSGAWGEANERRVEGETRPRKTREREHERRFARCDDESDGRGESKRERERDPAREIERGLRRDDARGDGRRRGANRANRAIRSRRLTVNDASKRAQIASFLWGAVSIRKTERAHRGELTRLRETKTLAELMSLNMGA